MKLDAFIEGLLILRKYHTKDGYNVGADHDVVMVFNPDTEISAPDIARLEELGWGKEDEGWRAFV